MLTFPHSLVHNLLNFPNGLVNNLLNFPHGLVHNLLHFPHGLVHNLNFLYKSISLKCTKLTHYLPPPILIYTIFTVGPFSLNIFSHSWDGEDEVFRHISCQIFPTPPVLNSHSLVLNGSSKSMHWSFTHPTDHPSLYMNHYPSHWSP